MFCFRFNRGYKAPGTGGGLVALAPVAGGATTARADVITLDVSGSMSPTAGINASCAPTGCTLGGNIVINNSPGVPFPVLSADVTVTGFPSDVGPFNRDPFVTAFGSLTELHIFDHNDMPLDLIVSTPVAGSLVGYTGGPLSDLTSISDAAAAACTAGPSHICVVPDLGVADPGDIRS